VTPGNLAGINWVDVPLTRRQSVATELAERINRELVTDGVITQEEWATYKEGGDRADSIITAEDLDGYYRGETSLPARAAKYANAAARANNIYLPHRDPRDGLMKGLAGVAFFFALVGVLESFTPIAFFHKYQQYEVVLWFFGLMLLATMSIVLLEVTRGNRGEA
jgi:hypothetical protein